ncbi:MAG: TetR/AcrR family transcriptional regulator [Oleiphilaceae bacterium]|nr:TetR/AcrR family transcriptional regulator [Oleiphilaceae bacterium]
MAYRETPRMRARKAANRERIVSVTQALVARGGFRNASIARIAAESGVAIGSVYRHFDSKSALFAEVFRNATEVEVARVALALQQASSQREALEQALRVFARRALRAPTMAWALIAEPVDPLVDEERLRYREAYARHFQQSLQAGIDQGDFAPQNARLASAALVGAIAESLVGPLSPAATDPDDQAARQLIEDIVQFCLHALQPLEGQPHERQHRPEHPLSRQHPRGGEPATGAAEL